MWKIKIIHFLSTLSLLLSFYYFVPSRVYALSIDDEKKMGEEFLLKIRKHFILLDDDFADSFFNELGQYLITSLEIKHFPFHFYIIKDDTINAFAAPGGHIFFFSGIIEVLSSVDELTAVLCHEIGHVSARHMSNRMEQSKKIGIATMAGILAGILVGGEAAGALITGSMAAGTQAQLHYSRIDERQADQLSFKYMKSAGFDPAGMINALKKIGRESWLTTDNIPPYLLSHPAGPERMSYFDTMLADYTPQAPKKEAERLRVLFPFFRSIVMAKSLELQQAEELFNSDLEKKAGTCASRLGLGIVYMRKLEYAQAISQLEKAFKEKPDFVPILANLGKAYQMNGQDSKAIPLFEKTMDKGHGDNSIRFLLGISYENMEQYGKAIRIFEKLTYLKPEKNEVYNHLGISYGRTNRLARAHYNFGIYYRKIGRSRKAVFHFQKAHNLSENDPGLRKKIEKARKAGLEHPPRNPKNRE
ncbi:MAG: M48 family metalloprotease [Desulfobacterales bacterium]|nr:M48 family metalloprotease [Desulfobacterales bacterium]